MRRPKAFPTLVRIDEAEPFCEDEDEARATKAAARRQRLLAKATTRRGRDPALQSYNLCNRDEAFVEDLCRDDLIFCLTDPAARDNPIIFASPQFCQFFQYEHQDIVGKNCRFLQCGRTNEADIDRMRVAIAHHKPVLVHVLNQKKDGTPLWNNLYLRPLYNRAAVPVLFVGVQTLVLLEDHTTVLIEQRPPDEIEWKEYIDKVRYGLCSTVPVGFFS